MDPNLMFVAGRIAGERGWSDAAVVTVAQLPVLEPTGAPLVLVADSTEISALVARLISSVDYVGRPIMVVCDRPVTPEAAVWLKPDLIQSLEDQSIPKLIPENPKITNEPSAHERREQEELAELVKVQKTPTLVPDQAASGKKSDESPKDAPPKDAPPKDGGSKHAASKEGGSKDRKDPPADKSHAPSKTANDKKSESKSTKQAPAPKSSTKHTGRSKADSRQSASAKGKASAEALREFRSLASD